MADWLYFELRGSFFHLHMFENLFKGYHQLMLNISWVGQKNDVVTKKWRKTKNNFSCDVIGENEPKIISFFLANDYLYLTFLY